MSRESNKEQAIRYRVVVVCMVIVWQCMASFANAGDWKSYTHHACKKVGSSVRCPIVRDAHSDSPGLDYVKVRLSGASEVKCRVATRISAYEGDYTAEFAGTKEISIFMENTSNWAGGSYALLCDGDIISYSWSEGN